VPNPLRQLPGCRFAERCPFADAHCHAAVPPLRAVGTAADAHQVACWKAPLDPDALPLRPRTEETA
jgi:oligopeptide/dipeptide ABC transporter ATP-binding protein